MKRVKKEYICPYCEENLVEKDDEICMECAIYLGKQVSRAEHINRCDW